MFITPLREKWREIINTLRGRFLLMAGVVLALLLVLAWTMHLRVTKVSSDSAGNVLDRHEVYSHTRDMSNGLWAANERLQDFLRQPTEASRQQFSTLVRDLIADADELRTNPWIDRNPVMRDEATTLHADLKKLDTQTRHLMEVRVTPERMFPAMPVMTEQMQPLTPEFVSLASLAVDEAVENPALPHQIAIERHFRDSQYAWSRMIDAFRLFVSNRFGIYDTSPENAMRVQIDAAREYAVRVRQNLDQLAGFRARGLLQIQQTESLEQMQGLLKRFLKHMQQAEAIWSSESWRLDSQIMQNQVKPLLESLWSRLRRIENAIDSHSTQDITMIAQAARALSESFWIVMLIGLAASAVAFFAFETQIRRPIARVVDALKAEAAGDMGVLLPVTKLAETRELAQSFDRMRRQVHSRQERLRAVLDNTAEGIITLDQWGHIEGFNQAAERLFGWREHEVTGMMLSDLVFQEDREQREGYVEHLLRTEIEQLVGHEGELTGRRKDQTLFTLSLKLSTMVLDGRPMYIALAADVSERKAILEHLRDMAEHDGLTGLHNRSYFQNELERVVERVHRSQHNNAALLYIDLDHFKYVNDTLGHAEGDRLLVEVASLLKKRARKSDLLVRLGGDEFIVLLYDVEPARVAGIAESFRLLLADYQFRASTETVTIGCSIGVAMITPATRNAAEALSQADLACHLAKRGGRNRVHAFAAADAQSAASMTLDMGWSRRIREAIERNRFVLACQPIVNTRSREIASYEVLVRMLDDDNSLIMPSGFLSTAERFGLSADIDKWIIVNAIETLANQRQTLPRLRYAINLSAQTLSDDSIADLIQHKLEEHALDPAALTFEVTETAAIADMPSAQALLARLQSFGCKTALDDFGSGMSSFAYLRDLPVDIVKIDGRFVKNLAASPVDQAMVKAMNDIAHALGKETVAEFVENEESFQLLNAIGVDYGQGYHLGWPEQTTPCQLIATQAGMVCAV
jgi:diguanylate cyclase (GGDEF)-like protein/PAS domain S-box-containing protein